MFKRLPLNQYKSSSNPVATSNFSLNLQTTFENNKSKLKQRTSRNFANIQYHNVDPFIHLSRPHSSRNDDSNDRPPFEHVNSILSYPSATHEYHNKHIVYRLTFIIPIFHQHRHWIHSPPSTRHRHLFPLHSLLTPPSFLLLHHPPPQTKDYLQLQQNTQSRYTTSFVVCNLFSRSRGFILSPSPPPLIALTWSRGDWKSGNWSSNIRLPTARRVHSIERY